MLAAPAATSNNSIPVVLSCTTSSFITVVRILASVTRLSPSTLSVEVSECSANRFNAPAMVIRLSVSIVSPSVAKVTATAMRMKIPMVLRIAAEAPKNLMRGLT